MDAEAAARIQKAEARANGGKVEKGSWAAKAQVRCLWISVDKASISVVAAESECCVKRAQ